VREVRRAKADADAEVRDRVDCAVTHVGLKRKNARLPNGQPGVLA